MSTARDPTPKHTMQTRLSSLTESCLNTASGFVVSWLVWVYIVVPYWNLPVRALRLNSRPQT